MYRARAGDWPGGAAHGSGDSTRARYQVWDHQTLPESSPHIAPGIYCFVGTITIQALGSQLVSPGTILRLRIRFESHELELRSSQRAGGLSLPAVKEAAAAAVLRVQWRRQFSGGAGVTINGSIFAPNGPVVLTGGNNVQRGYIQCQTITINNGGTTFLGNGPGSTDTTTTETVPTGTTTYPGTTTVIITPGNTYTTTTPAQTSTTGTTIGLGE